MSDPAPQRTDGCGGRVRQATPSPNPKSEVHLSSDMGLALIWLGADFVMEIQALAVVHDEAVQLNQVRSGASSYREAHGPILAVRRLRHAAEVRGQVGQGVSARWIPSRKSVFGRQAKNARRSDERSRDLSGNWPLRPPASSQVLSCRLVDHGPRTRIRRPARPR